MVQWFNQLSRQYIGMIWNMSFNLHHLLLVDNQEMSMSSPQVVTVLTSSEGSVNCLKSAANWRHFLVSTFGSFVFNLGTTLERNPEAVENAPGMLVCPLRNGIGAKEFDLFNVFKYDNSENIPVHHLLLNNTKAADEIF